MTIDCGNCGHPVTDDYFRVLTPEGFDQPQMCPNCEDRTRRADGRADLSRSAGGNSPRSQTVAHTHEQYQEALADD